MEIELDGHRVHIAAGGSDIDPNRDNLLFFHGAAMDHTVWTLFRRYFARRNFNALGVDLPGHGRSGGAPLTTVEALGAWAERLLGELGIERYSAAGHSLGSLVALELAARTGDRARRLALLGSSFPMSVGDALLDAARADDERAIDMIMMWGHDFASQIGANPVAGVHVVNVARRLMTRARPQVLFTDLNACNSYANGLAAAAGIACPVSLILGRQDRMTPPRAAQVLTQSLSRASVEVLDHCGHMMMAEQPEATHRALAQAFT